MRKSNYNSRHCEESTQDKHVATTEKYFADLRRQHQEETLSTSVFFPSTCNLLCYYHHCCCYHCYCHPKYLNNPARIKLSLTSLFLVFFSSKRLLCQMSSSSGDVWFLKQNLSRYICHNSLHMDCVWFLFFNSSFDIDWWVEMPKCLGMEQKRTWKWNGSKLSKENDFLELLHLLCIFVMLCLHTHKFTYCLLAIGNV